MKHRTQLRCSISRRVRRKQHNSAADKAGGYSRESPGHDSGRPSGRSVPDSAWLTSTRRVVSFLISPLLIRSCSHRRSTSILQYCHLLLTYRHYCCRAALSQLQRSNSPVRANRSGQIALALSSAAKGKQFYRARIYSYALNSWHSHSSKRITNSDPLLATLWYWRCSGEAS